LKFSFNWLALRPALPARLSRRQLLGGGIAALAAVAGGGCLLLSEEVRPVELDAFDAVLRRLGEVTGPSLFPDVPSAGSRG
jgi:hypothetical protein